MNVKELNSFLINELTVSEPPTSLFPNLALLNSLPCKFARAIGLEPLPLEPGLILIRGARQLGKSTWMEDQIWQSRKKFGPGSVLYLNGDYVNSKEELEEEIRALLPMFAAHAEQTTPRLFIDEITNIEGWQTVLKRLYDSGHTRHLLIITTGSHSQDLRHGAERLPGRRGRLARTQFYFPPLSYPEFRSAAERHFGNQTLIAYLLTGGSPLAANELVRSGQIPEYVYDLTREWIYGECARAGRSRYTLLWLAQALWTIGVSPVSVNQLARDAGAANNTVMHGYLDVLLDSLALAVSLPHDAAKGRPVARRPAKYPWINLLAAWCFFPARPAALGSYDSLNTHAKGAAWEWLVAQELWRRAALAGQDAPDIMGFYRDANHEIDFVSGSEPRWLEVKAGPAEVQEFLWFRQLRPKDNLTVVSQSSFEIEKIRGITFEQFLMGEPAGVL